MTKKEIITEIAKNKTVENLIKTHTDFANNPYIDDLAQDIYISLMSKSEELIIGLYNNDEINYFISKMIKNNLYSSNSPFYYQYQKFRKITDEIGDNLDEEY